MENPASDKPLSVDALVNLERLLDFALCHVDMTPLGQMPHEVADEIIAIYILNEFRMQGNTDFTEDDITDRYKELVVGYTVAKLVEKGELEVDMSGEENVYNLTNKDNNGN